jgi:hypothetical protein
MAEDYTKAQLLEALKAAGEKLPKKTPKGELVVAYYNLKRGPQATARKVLVGFDEPAPEPKAEKPKKASSNGAAKTEDGITIPSFPKTGQYAHITVWAVLKGSTRGFYGTGAAVDGDTVHFTKVNGETVDIPVDEIAVAAGEAELVEAVA